MRFAVSLLTILGIAAIIGTVLKQNEPYNNYIVQLGQFWFEFFEMLGLFDVYHSVWFLVILVFLVTSTSLCVYRNSPLMLKEMRAWRENATEKSLRSFSHQQVYLLQSKQESLRANLLNFLTARGFRFKTVKREDGSELIAAKAGSYQRLGYIFTHAAIVIICIGGLLDGNVPFKIQELFGQKVVETLDIPADKVPEKSRMGKSNLSFRANMTLSEGTSANVAFMRIRDGYLVQELPFEVALTDFRIEHYATGQPKSFESDLVITDPDLKTPIKHTISVNHPWIYKGIAIYQSDFQDGGSQLKFNVWNLFDSSNTAGELKGEVFGDAKLGKDASTLTVELNDFRKFNILNLSADGKGKPHNVGANVTYKLRDQAGQAHEYVSYMQPMQLGGQHYFVSGMRSNPQEDFKYLRIPVDDELSIDGFMQLRAVLFNEADHAPIAKKLTATALGDNKNEALRQQFEIGVVRLLKAFSQGGYSEIAKVIEKSVPVAEREKAAQAYIKIFNSAVYEAYALSLERAGKKAPVENQATTVFLQDSMNAMSDMFFYGAPYYLQMTNFEHREASGLQLTKSPGQNLVYTGSVLLVLGIFAMIYVRERRIWLLVKENEVLFAMSANRKNPELDVEFLRYKEQLQRLIV